MAFKEDKIQTTVLLNAQKAINDLGKLEMEAKEVKNALKGMQKGTSDYIAKSKELEDVGNRYDKLRKEIKLTDLTTRQLNSINRKLRNELSYSATRGTASYKELKMEIIAVGNEIKKRKADLSGTNSLMSKMGRGLGKAGNAGAAMMGIALTIEGLMSVISGTVEGMATLSDSIADVQKTTGLTRKEVDELNASFKKIDTRTSRKELLALATIAGKLGIQGKQNIEGFVNSADKLVVALGEDLGGDAEETIKAVGKLVDLFKVKEQFGIEEGLTKVGSTINSLGAASSASEGYMVDFTKRMGGIAPNANISISSVLGLAATLDQLGQTSETSSTVMGQLLIAIGKDMPTFAKIAGTSVANLSKLLEEDANEAMIQVLEGAKSTKGGLVGLAESMDALGLEGTRAIQVVGTLANNTDLLRDQQALANKEFDSGTSIMQEFNTKNQNFAAQLEKLKKTLYSIFVNSTLMKGLELFVGGLNELLKTTETTEQAVKREVSEMNALFTVIKDTTTETNIRKAAIEKLNTTYGKYLPKLLTEKSSLDEIKKAQKEANKALIQNIILKKESEKLEQAVLRSMEKQKSLLADLETRNKELLSYQKQLNEAQANRDKAFDEGTMTESLASYYNNRIDNAQRGIDVAEKEIDLLNQFAKSIASGASIDLIKLETDRMLKAFGLDRKPTITPIKPKPDPDLPPELNTTASSASETKEIDDLLAKWQEFNDELKRLSEERDLSMQDADVQELARMDAKYEALLNKAREFFEKGAVGEAEYRARLDEINLMHSEDLKAFEARKREEFLQEEMDFYDEHSRQVAEANAKELKQKEELFNAQMFLLGSYSDLVGATNELIGTQGEKGAEFAKKLAVFQLAIDTASAISAAVAGATKAANAGGPAAPFLLAGYITSMVATVISGVAKAKKLLSDEPPKYATGGYTGPGTGKRDETGFKPAGIVHEGEYVVPQYLLRNNQFVADQVAMIEALRLGKSLSFAVGGMVPSGSAGNVLANAQSGENTRIQLAMLAEMQAMRQDISELKGKKSYAYFDRNTLVEIDEYEDQVRRSEADSAL